MMQVGIFPVYTGPSWEEVRGDTPSGSAEYYRKYQQFMRATNPAWTTRRRVQNRKWHANNPEKRRENGRVYYERLKDQFYRMYGTKCNWCGETTVECLTLDHVQDDGFLDRREGRKTQAVLRKAIEKEDRWKYQTLCCNCQARKAKIARDRAAAAQRQDMIDDDPFEEECDAA